MTIIARRVSALPARSAMETWATVTEIVCSEDDQVAGEFSKVGGVMASLIGDKTPEDHPIIVKGTGPRIRAYCVYGEEAIISEGDDENSVAHDPFQDSWGVYVPVSEEDLEWASDALSDRSQHFIAYSTEEGAEVDDRAGLPSRVEVDVETWRSL